MEKNRKESDPIELFAAANSGEGFKSFYDGIFDTSEIERRYLIKGGPGTGKSTFMRTVAKEAEERGLSVEYYRCSSDPQSLDAVVIEGRAAVLDATSPHNVEPRLVGARDEIVNLGIFWDNDGLSSQLELIRELTSAKAEQYKRAYQFLSAAMTLDNVIREASLRYTDKEKMKRAARRYASTIPFGDGFSLKVGICGSVGMQGSIRLDTYEKNASSLYYVRDYHRTGSLFIAKIIEEAQKNRNAVRVSYCPINPSYPDAVTFVDTGETFVLSDAPGESPASDGKRVKIINMKRFIGAYGLTKEAQREYKLNARMYDALILSAEECLRRAGEYHFELEEIYKRYVDFGAQSIFARSFAEFVVSRLCGDERA